MHKGCKNFVIPKTRTDFWMEKLQSNVYRDVKNSTSLENDGWKVIIVWECDVQRSIEPIVNNIIEQLRYDRNS